MSLCLTIISYHALTPGQISEVTLEGGAMTIGRDPESDWVLSDPQCLVAPKHCVIQYLNGHYCISDVSHDGLGLISAGIRMGHGNSELLENGKVIRIGDYEINARIDAVMEQLPTTFSGTESVEHFDTLFKCHQAYAPLPLNDAPAIHVQDSSVQQTALDLFDFLTHSSVPSATQSDHVPAEHHEFRPPVPLTPSVSVVQPVPTSEQGAIPEDWDLLVEVPSVSVMPSVPQAPAISDLFNAFLRGAGMEPLPLDATGVEAQMETLGRSYRLMVEGLTDLLHDQASLKNETSRQPQAADPAENNPLKFAANATEALLLLLRPGNHPVMPLEQVIADGFAEVRANREAMVAGAEASITLLLKRFEPALLEAHMRKPGALATFIDARQGGRWQQFSELYTRLAQEAEDEFQVLFHRETRRAAEAHRS